MDKQDELRYLKILAIFHWVAAVFTGLIACFPIIHFLVGLAMMGIGFGIGSFSESNSSFFEALIPGAVGVFFTLIAGGTILLGWALAVCQVLVGFFLYRKKHPTFCFIVACIECSFPPWGTALGVFTFIMLLRPSVKAAFEEHALT
jgi:hypothetical protein